MKSVQNLITLSCISLLFSCSGGDPKTEEDVVNAEGHQKAKAEYICTKECAKDEKDKSGNCRDCELSMVKKINTKDLGPLSKQHSDYSVFQLDANWKNQDKEPMKLSALKGKLTLTTMIFTRCDYACPNMLKDLKDIEKKLSSETRERLQIAVVTIDPDNDTPEVMKEFAGNMGGIDFSRWSFLHGSKDDIYSYSTLLDFGYRKFEDGVYGHANQITLLNTEGEIVYQLDGLHAENAAIVELINKLDKQFSTNSLSSN